MHVSDALISSFNKSTAEMWADVVPEPYFKERISVPKAVPNSETCRNKSPIANNRNFTATNSKSGLIDIIPLDTVTVPV